MRLVPTVIGIMFMLMANILPCIQPNWWIGFRTPWTLLSAESWNRTHRLGGKLGIPAGILNNSCLDFTNKLCDEVGYSRTDAPMGAHYGCGFVFLR